MPAAKDRTGPPYLGETWRLRRQPSRRVRVDVLTQQGYRITSPRFKGGSAWRRRDVFLRQYERDPETR